MNWTQETKDFIVKHLDDDTSRLLLSAHRYEGIDVAFAVDQIQARKQIKTKLPEWFANAEIIMGGRVPAEQCSSEQTARYKQGLVRGNSLCDMTGGMGVDLYYMSRGLEKAVYTERQPQLCQNALHNFAALGATNITVREGDGRDLEIPFVDTIYLDPARRASDGSRVFDLADCEPNVVVWQDQLLAHCKRLIVKMSPMADISQVLRVMPSISELHIVGVKNECKEVIAVCESDKTQAEVRIVCVDFRANDTVSYSYNLLEESNCESVLATQLGKYLYEPDVTLMKAGVFKLLCKAFNVLKLDINSHLYTSNELQPSFPGRIFEIEQQLDFSSKNMKTLKKEIPQANITARNFVLTADQLRTKTGIKDGGSVYLFASVMHKTGNIMLKCKKALFLLMIMFSAITGVMAQRKTAQKETLETMLAGITAKSPALWYQDMEFVYLNKDVNFVLQPETIRVLSDTADYTGTLWHFDSVVSEEDWMGQKTMALRFISPSGEAYRFSTDRLMTQVEDTTYVPSIPGLYPKYIIDEVSAVMCAHTLYILINDERVSDGDTVKVEKFVPVTIDSVSFGTELAPLKICYSYSNGRKAYLLTSLPNSRENATSTPINKLFSVNDPFESYPNIRQEIWKRIQRSEVVIDMTREECRLSLGKPSRTESANTRGGVVERWHYMGGKVLEFWDGYLTRVGREK